MRPRVKTKSSRAASALLSILLINMTRVKAPMNGLSLGQATTSYFEKRPEKVDRPARAVIFKTARAASTKDHVETLWGPRALGKLNPKQTGATPIGIGATRISPDEAYISDEDHMSMGECRGQ